MARTKKPDGRGKKYKTFLVTACYWEDCPFCTYIGGPHRCSLAKRVVPKNLTPPEWCPLKKGPVLVTLDE